MFASLQWQISTGDLFELLRPAAYTLAVVLSTLVLADTRRRRFKPHAVILWTLSTLLLPHVTPFLYLITYLAGRTRTTNATQPTDATNATATPDVTNATTTPDATDASTPDAPTPAADATFKQHASQPPTKRPRLCRTLPLLYAVTLLACVALYFYLDYQSPDAHLARAANARLRNQHERAVREYIAALSLDDDPHTHKLLALQLFDARRYDDALAEFRLAERGGEPDPLLPLRIAATLDALKRPAEAAPEYQKFLAQPICTQTPPDARCTQAQVRIGNIGSEIVR